jgi:hypothetical protein
MAFASFLVLPLLPEYKIIIDFLPLCFYTARFDLRKQ